MTRFIVAFLASVAIACGPTPNIKDVIVECAQGDQDLVRDFAAELLPLLNLDAPDWRAIESAAVAHGVQIGGCALAELVNAWLSRPRATPQTQAAADALENVRRAFGGNIAWRLNGQVL